MGHQVVKYTSVKLKTFKETEGVGVKTSSLPLGAGNGGTSSLVAGPLRIPFVFSPCCFNIAAISGRLLAPPL